jgi:hypothetical protein
MTHETLPARIDSQDNDDHADDFAKWEQEFATPAIEVAPQKELPASPAAAVEKATHRIIDLTPLTNEQQPRNNQESADDNIIDAEVIEENDESKAGAHVEDKENSVTVAEIQEKLAKEKLTAIGHDTLAITPKATIESTPSVQALDLAANKNDDPKIAEKISKWMNEKVPDQGLSKKMEERGGFKSILKDVTKHLKDSASARWQKHLDSLPPLIKDMPEQKSAPSNSPEAEIDTEVERYRQELIAKQKERDHTEAHKMNMDSVHQEAFSDSDYIDSVHAEAFNDSDYMDSVHNEALEEYKLYQEARREASLKARAANIAKRRRQQARQKVWDSLSDAGKEHWGQLRSRVSKGPLGRACRGIALDSVRHLSRQRYKTRRSNRRARPPYSRSKTINSV